MCLYSVCVFLDLVSPGYVCFLFMNYNNASLLNCRESSEVDKNVMSSEKVELLVFFELLEG